MLRKLRKLIKESPLLNVLFYRFSFWFANDVLKVKKRLIKRYGYEAVSRILNVSKQVGIRCFPNYGTLLGFVREGGFIKHDLDIDLSLLPGEVPLKCFYDALVENGFYFDHFITIDGRLHILTMRYHEMPIDIYQEHFSFDKTQLEYLTNKTDKGWPVICYPVPKGFESISVGGVSVEIPVNANEILCALYGNWHKVVKEWNDSMAPDVKMDLQDHQWHLSYNVEEWLNFCSRN